MKMYKGLLKGLVVTIACLTSAMPFLVIATLYSP